MMFGLDFLALPKYADVAARSFPSGWALGVFSSTFGDARPAVERIVRSGKCPRVRVHLAWKDDHKFTTKDFAKIEREAKKWIALVDKYPKIDWQFSGACEHHLNPEDSIELAKQVLAVLLGTTYVNTGDHDIKGPSVINEVHQRNDRIPRTNYNFSFDGVACVDSDVEKIKERHRGSDTFYLWDSRFNGRWETTDTTPRSRRKGWPDSKLIKSIILLSTTCGAVSLSRNWLYKSHAENKGTGDKRAEKPVIISPLKVNKIELKQGDLTVATFHYFGKYTDGRHRYYATKMGYEIAQQSVEVFAAGKKYGEINPIFREGEWRS